ncbi:MAG: alanine--tRNA ligase, partial [Verrucomicrobiales bacterium]|nr:alanine--tRNA ligase [Verrucomicrobiales bacterium]
SADVSQKGSFVGPDKLTFDFNSAPLTPQQVADVERLVNERILENAEVAWVEVPFAEVKARRDIMQFFGDKYGEQVRVVQVGGRAGALDGYSMELCGGTHARGTGEIGLFRVLAESAIAAGVRRIEAVAGLAAFDAMRGDRDLVRGIAARVNSPWHEVERKVESLLAHQKELEKALKAAQQREAAHAATALVAGRIEVGGIPLIVKNLGAVDGDYVQGVAEALKATFKGVVVLGASAGGAVTLVAAVAAEFTKQVQAGRIVQQLAPLVGGKGGGRPDFARGGGKDATRLDEALASVRALLGEG